MSQRKKSLRSRNNLLKSIYENVNHPASFSSPRQLFLAAKKKDEGIQMKDVNKWLESNRTYTLHRQVKTRFRRRPVLVRGPFHQYQADLMDFQDLARYNDGVHYLLTIIDCFSRFAIIIPIKNKSGIAVRDGFKKAFKLMKIPKKLQTDDGKEFFNHVTQRFFKENNIVHFSTDQELKAQICERFNRTVRDKIKKYLTSQKSYRYVDAIPAIIDSYNSKPHSSLGYIPPKDVDHKNRDAVFQELYGDFLREKSAKQKFKIGDKVRLAKYRRTFRKRNETNFTDELFDVIDVRHKKSPVIDYIIRDPVDNTLIKGAFYAEQLQKFQEADT